MDSSRSTISSLIFAFVIAAAVVAGASYFLPSANISGRLNAQTTAKPLPKVQWDAAAPGRVEPNGGEIRIGAVRLQVTGETDPCSRMEEQCAGLKAALQPDWRGGVCCRVLQDGAVRIGDTVSFVDTQ